MAVELRSVRFAYPQLPNVPVLNRLDLSYSQANSALLWDRPVPASPRFSLSSNLSTYMPSSGAVYLDKRPQLGWCRMRREITLCTSPRTFRASMRACAKSEP